MMGEKENFSERTTRVSRSGCHPSFVRRGDREEAVAQLLGVLRRAGYRHFALIARESPEDQPPSRRRRYIKPAFCSAFPFIRTS
jgi:hypothetical protein